MKRLKEAVLSTIVLLNLKCLNHIVGKSQNLTAVEALESLGKEI